MRSPRSVTIAPTGMPWRSLNCAIDFVARRITAFWPVIFESSSAPTSASFALVVASPRPMLTTTFWSFGMAITFL